MNRLFDTKKRIAAVVLAGVILAVTAGAAAAYFTASGSGTSTAYVGSSVGFSVNVAFVSPGQYLYPDSGPGAGPNIEHYDYAVTNTGGGSEILNTATVSISNLPGGCSANWFDIDGAGGAYGSHTQNIGGVTLAPNGVYNGTATVELVDSGGAQDACLGATPTVTVVAST